VERLKQFRSWFARQVLRLARAIDPETQDDVHRIQRYNENLNIELTRERSKRAELSRIIREKERKIKELEDALEARKAKVH
jgi:hypothetical protein